MTRVPVRPAAHAAGPIRAPRSAHVFDEGRRDPYEVRRKFAEPTVCDGCGAVYHRGHWQWSEIPEGAAKVSCPACTRAAERQPAGYLILSGPYVEAHRDELMRVVRNEEAAEKGEHPLHRIMGIEDAPQEVVVTTTDVHLPRRIGEALRKAHHGKLELSYGDGEYVLRARWHG